MPLYILLIAVLLYPRWPKYFREAESGRRRIKFSLLAVMIIGAYVAVS
jgi:hypothetical protein